MPPFPATSRAYSGRSDLSAMEAIVSAAWASPVRPLVHCTVGDLEWWLVGGGPDVDWSTRIRVWSIGGDPVGWGWFTPPASLDWFVRFGLKRDEESAIRDEILAWHVDRARAVAAETPVAPATGATGESSTTDPVRLEVWAADGWPEAAILPDRGWTPTDVVLTQFIQRLDFDLDPPRVPDGYVLRSMRGPDDIPARVEAHRAAFAPSRMTVEKHALLTGLDHYALDRDIVLEAADGSVAAFAICWEDRVGSIGEFEPVGTHPDHQRRGLGRVIMRHGLRLMRETGLRDALVFSLRSNAASEALYRSAGFDEVALHRQYTRPLDLQGPNRRVRSGESSRRQPAANP
jgi:ribosomal protein S18 acetylase RimI-like enzyme